MVSVMGSTALSAGVLVMLPVREPIKDVHLKNIIANGYAQYHRNNGDGHATNKVPEAITLECAGKILSGICANNSQKHDQSEFSEKHIGGPGDVPYDGAGFTDLTQNQCCY
ncbi:MAG: hypothetical protein V5A51_12010 [Bacteroidales bacterium]